MHGRSAAFGSPHVQATDLYVIAHSVTWYESNGNTVVQADVNGNTTADMVIVLSGTNLHLTSSDFLI